MKNNWKNKMMQFMQGRYGADQMGQMLSAVSMVFLIISLFSRNQGWFLLALIGIVYNYFRMFSKNISKRYAENQKYLTMTAGIRRKLASWKSQLAQRKIYHIYRCPGCKQKIRVPRGRGKIEIRCPKCNTRFVKKS
jgi:putative Zn-finger domain protein